MLNKTPDTLRDINQRLKNRSINKRTPKNKIVFRIWTKERYGMTFVSEASTLNFFNRKWPRNKCPYCEGAYRGKDLSDENNKSWTFVCPGCKSTLVILKE